MKQPDLQMLAQWLDPVLIAELENRRRLNNEIKRRRKLQTLHMLWLMLAVSLDTQRNSLHEILRLVTGLLDIKWTVSVAAFCKARTHFSPSALYIGYTGCWYRGYKKLLVNSVGAGTGCGCLLPTRQRYPYLRQNLFGNVLVHTRDNKGWGQFRLSFAAYSIW